MAAEQDLKLDQAEPKTEGGGKKKLIIIIVGVLLVIAIAVGVTTFFMLSGDESAEDSAAEASEDIIEETSKVKQPAQYIKMQPKFIVNYNVGTRQRFLQASVEIMTRSQEVVDAFQLHNPMFRNEVVRILSEQDFKHLRTPEGRTELITKLQNRLEDVLLREADVEGIEAVLFTNFVMQ